MLGELPRTLDINGSPQEIRAGFVNVLRVVSAFHDNALTDREKALVCLRRIYKRLSTIPPSDFADAYQNALRFIEGPGVRKTSKCQLVDWERDEALIFPAINAVAGCEVREMPEIHWWTFLGYFQNIDPESLCGTVLCIRQKRAKHKRLEKYEQTFYNANRELCELTSPKARKENAYDYLDALYAELRTEGGKEGE